MNDVLIGTVVRVAEHPGARAPSFLLTVDFGQRGMHQTVLPSGDYEREQLEGSQIACRLEPDGPVVAGAHSHGKGFVLLRPDREVEAGTLVS